MAGKELVILVDALDEVRMDRRLMLPLLRTGFAEDDEAHAGPCHAIA